jgi:spermidine synthase
VILERVTTERGELVLREQDGALEVISNGVFLMDTRAGASERLLVRAVLETLPPGGSLLVGGLGVGFSLAEAAASGVPGRIVVVELEPDVVRWHRGPLAPFSAGALEDPRVEVVCTDLVRYLATDERFDAICLDVDNGPDWTVFDGNRALYTADGLRLLGGRLNPGGVLAIWSASEPAGFADALGVLGTVEVRRVPMPRGEPDVVYLVRP